MKNFLKKNKKIAIIALAVLLFGLLFISVPIGVFPDSIIYYGYTKIFQGIDPISSWNLLRGPSFPFVLYLFVTFLGGAIAGLLIGAYLIFLGMIYALYKIVRYFIDQIGLKRWGQIITYGLLVILVVINPIIFGYFHALLTEYLVMLLTVLSCVFAWLWMETSFVPNRRKYVLLSLFFIILMPFVWFIKQPYLTVAIFPWAIAAILALANKFNWGNLAQRLATLCAGAVSLVLAIFAWQAFLTANGVNFGSTSGSGGFISYGLINGVSNAKLIREPQISDAYIDMDYLTIEDKDKIDDAIEDSELSVNLWVLYDMSGENIVDEIPIYFTGSDMPLSVSLSAWKTMIAEHPLSTLDSYTTNYLATADFYDYGVNDNGQWGPYKKAGLYGHENYSIGLLFLTYPYNMSDWTNESASKMGLVQIENKHMGIRNLVLNIWGKPYIGLYILTFVLLPAIFIAVIVLYIKRRRKGQTDIKTRLYTLALILLGFSLFNVMFNAFFGSLMDRYAYVAWPCVSLSLILLVMIFIKNRSDKKTLKKPKTHRGSVIASAKSRHKLPR